MVGRRDTTPARHSPWRQDQESIKEGTLLMKSRLTALISTVAVATVLAGCAAGGGQSDRFSEDASEREIKVWVTNLAFMDATIYGVVNSGRRRLGRVPGKGEAILTMPFRAPSEMYLEIDLLAGPTCETERMTVDPGDHLELIIQNENAGWRCRAD